MINSIGVDNFRSLCDINDIEIKPMTVLLGKNSCGKSSFLRILPMLKQSISRRTRGTIALFGDLVDFGEFETVKNDSENNKKDYIEFSFKGKINKDTEVSSLRIREKKRISLEEYKLEIKIKKYTEEDFLYISDLKFTYNDNVALLSLDVKNNSLTKFEINNVSFLKILNNLKFGYYIFSSFLPEFYIEYENGSFFGNPATESLNKVFSKHFNDIFTEFQIARIVRELEYEDKNDLKNKITNILELDELDEKILSFERKLEANSIANKIFDALEFKNFMNVYQILEEELRNTFLNICYSKPLRANTERFYRNQPLTVNEVDPDGSNLVQFYSTMSSKLKNNFHQWMDENFDFHYEVEKQIGLQSIVIIDSKTKEKHSINDMGFGFTQILPIVTQEWSLINKPRRTLRNKDTIFVIEQPELHLHPAFQCKLIKAFANTINIAAKSNISIRFVIETHSETIINFLGSLVERKEINKDDVSVLIFTKTKNLTAISESSYKEDGVLTNWPIGFFGE